MLPKTRWPRQIIAVLAGLSWLLAACADPPPAPALTATPLPSPTCYPLPQPTGEKYLPPTIEAAPPMQVSPGQTITVTFSGGYIILNNAITCGETVVEYKYSDELPNFTWDRRVEVWWDDQVLATVQCAYRCRVETAVPQDASPGAHQLSVDAFMGDEITFDLQVR